MQWYLSWVIAACAFKALPVFLFALPSFAWHYYFERHLLIFPILLFTEGE